MNTRRHEPRPPDIAPSIADGCAWLISAWQDPAAARLIIAALTRALEASGDPYLQRAAADALRQAADRLRL